MYNLEFGKLHITPKGNKYILVENNHKGMIRLECSIRRGSNLDPKGKEGLHHFLEHMLFKGTDNMNSEEFNNKMKYYGAEHNAMTSPSETSYHINALSDYLEEVSELFFKSFSTPALLFTNSEDLKLEEERSVILEEISMYQTPDSLVNIKMENLLLHGVNKEYMKTIGNEDSVNSITKEDLIEAYMGYNKEDILLIVCANQDDPNITDDSLLKLIENYEDYFEVFQDQSSRADGLVFHKDINHSEVIEGLPYNAVVMAYDIPVTELEVYSVFNNYVRMLDQILFNEVREKLGLCYYIGSMPIALENPDTRVLNIITTTQQPNKASTMIEHIMKNFKDYVTEDIFHGTVVECKRHILKQDRIQDINYKMARYLYNKDFNFDSFMHIIDKYMTYENFLNFIDKIDLSRNSMLIFKKGVENNV